MKFQPWENNDPNVQPHPRGRLYLGLMAAIDMLQAEANQARQAEGMTASDRFRDWVVFSACEYAAQYLREKLEELTDETKAAPVLERAVRGQVAEPMCPCGQGPLMPGRAGCADCEREVNQC